MAGRIVDENGEPVASVGVNAMRYTYSNDGQRRLTLVNRAGTDDLGQFRIFGLMPGDYVVQASAGAIPSLGAGPPGPESSATTYYPGTSNADEAQTVTLAVGQETTLQFSLVAPKPASRVSGTVVNSEGAPLAGMALSLVTSTGGGTGFMSNGEPITLRIVTSPGATLSGRVVWEGNTSRGTTPLRVRIVQTVNQGPLTLFGSTVPGADGTLGEDNTFKLAGAAGKGWRGRDRPGDRSIYPAID
jgi:hypothetical protein